MLERTPRKNRTEVTFGLPTDISLGRVSAVGNFNDWQPGAHTDASPRRNPRCDRHPARRQRAFLPLPDSRRLLVQRRTG
ncbi:hypothetical protein [Streptomyces vinaceus]|uniref:hypothetical protein n=1 Tax=Streptomyces vinaceus TaxID=1960 RepID=UPI00382F45BE